MRSLVFTTRLAGRLTDIGPGLGEVTLSAPDGARLRSQLTFIDPERFREQGTLELSDGRALSFETIGEGHLGASIQPGVRHGTAARVIAGGRGRITSNFLVAADGSVTDDEVAVLFTTEQEDHR